MSFCSVRCLASYNRRVGRITEKQLRRRDRTMWGAAKEDDAQGRATVEGEEPAEVRICGDQHVRLLRSGPRDRSVGRAEEVEVTDVDGVMACLSE